MTDDEFSGDDIEEAEIDWDDVDWEDFVFENGVMYLEERGERRFRLHVNVTLRAEGHEFSAFSGDISDSGLFVATPEILPEGTEVDLKFKLPREEEAIELRGEVRWTREKGDYDREVVPGFGVKFLDLVSEDRFRLLRYLDDLEVHERLRTPPE